MGSGGDIPADDTAGDDAAVAERVRRDLAELADEASAPEPPADVTARVITALRSQPAHSIRRPRLRRLQVLGLVVGVCAALAGAIIGVRTLMDDPAPPLAVGPQAEKITVPARAIPLSDAEILDLLDQNPDFGPLSDPHRRASCLDGLGYPATDVLGARPLTLSGKPALLVLLPGESPRSVAAMVVEPNCNAAHTGLLANTVVTRP